MRIFSIVAASAVLLAAAVSGAAAGSSSAVRCNLWAAPYGADTNPGSQGAPFLTVAKLAGALVPGQTGCLAAGASFASREVITAVGTRAGRITITTAPGGTSANLLDGIETTQATRFLTLTNLAIGALDDSASRNVGGTVILRGYSTALTRSNVGPGTLREIGRSCVVLDHAGAALIQGNVLHECNGVADTQYSAGVLATISVGARIFDNLIYGNVGGDAIAFSPNAQLSQARRNLMVGNLGGVYFGGGPNVASRDTLVEQNVITQNSRFDVHSAYTAGAPVGSGNLVQKNCLWSPGAVVAAGAGFRLRANRSMSPRVVSGQGVYLLAATSPCRAYRPRL